jgi:recombination protein RecT
MTQESTAVAKTNGNEITKRDEGTPQLNTFRDLLMRAEPILKQVAASHMNPERLIRLALAAMSRNPQIMQCDKNSILQAVMTASQMGLEPNTPLQHAAIVPYWNGSRLEAQFQPMYKGLISLAFRGGEVTQMRTVNVYEQDEFEYEEGLEPKLIHKPNLKAEDRGKVVASYLITRMKNTPVPFLEVMSRSQLLAVKAKALANKKNIAASPWTTSEDEMFRKTVLKRGAKSLPLSIEFVKAVAMDNAIESGEAIDYTALELEATEETQKQLEPPHEPTQKENLMAAINGKTEKNEPSEMKPTDNSAEPPKEKDERLDTILSRCIAIADNNDKAKKTLMRSWTDNQFDYAVDLKGNEEMINKVLDRSSADYTESKKSKTK